MKFRVFVFLVLASVALCFSPFNRFEVGILKLIEKCKAVPALNPLKIPPLSSSHPDFNLFLGEVTIDGFQNLRVTALSTDPHRYLMTIDFYVPRLTIHSDQYYLETSRGNYIVRFNAVFTGNSFTCYISDLYVRADVQFRQSGSDTVISGLRMQYTGNVWTYFSGSPYFVNENANARIFQMMSDRTAIGNVENMIKERANRYLRGHTPEQFIQSISNI